jgi:hypothetical protein
MSNGVSLIMVTVKDSGVDLFRSNPTTGKSGLNDAPAKSVEMYVQRAGHVMATSRHSLQTATTLIQ